MENKIFNRGQVTIFAVARETRLAGQNCVAILDKKISRDVTPEIFNIREAWA